MRYFSKNNGVNWCFGLLLVLLLFGFSLDGIAQQAKSDYEIQKEFKKKFEDITQQLEESGSSTAVQKLTQDIKQLEENYAGHEELLDIALYPDTYKEKMNSLKRRVLVTEQQLATIEKQEQKLKELTGELASYDTRLDIMNDRTDSLQNAIRKSLKSEEQLSGMVRRYRQSLEERDELILSFVDSVMITYQRLNIESMQDLENAKKKARFNADGNALRMIRDIANENISLLESDSRLSTEEYLRMGAVHSEFKTMWKKVGDKLVEIYADDKQEARESMNGAIQAWDDKLTTLTWASIDSSLQESGISVGSFDDSESFYNTLNAYLADATEASKNGGSESNLSAYEKFSSFWNEQVQLGWSPHIINAGVLSSEQMASIDQQLKQWASNAEPESNLLVYLFGFSLLAVVALGVMLAREKRNKTGNSAS